MKTADQKQADMKRQLKKEQATLGYLEEKTFKLKNQLQESELALNRCRITIQILMQLIDA